MNIEQLTEVSRYLLPYAFGVFVFAYLYGWLSPLVSEEQRYRVVNTYNRLNAYIRFAEQARIDTGKRLGFTRELVDLTDRVRVQVLNITRGAFVLNG